MRRFCARGLSDQELHAVQRWVKVVTEGPEHLLFENAKAVEQPEENVQLNVELPDVETVDEELLNTFDAENIDDNNLPVPENVPNGNVDASACTYCEWGHDGTCHRSKTDVNNFNASLQVPVENPSLLTLFETLFPVDYVKLVIILKTNEGLTSMVGNDSVDGDDVL